MKALRIVAGLVLCAVAVSEVRGDPRPGEVLKFVQYPMIATPIGPIGVPPVGPLYYGHDELSTAYCLFPPILPPPGTNQVPIHLSLQGKFMADDFADKVSTPVVHVRWWGSYLNQHQFGGIKTFLIAFEDDIPVDPTNPFSRPGGVLSREIVSYTPGVAPPPPGLFTEKVIRAPDPILGEALYEYNAELACPFAEQKDTVYWLKIVALVDPAQQGPIEWGWHNRDYTIPDPLASMVVVPGERDEGPLPTGEPIWHFQDDAVMGNIAITGALDRCNVIFDQAMYAPTSYISLPDGPPPIDQHSKDLAFELYTVPEPAGASLSAVCATTLAAFAGWRRRSRR